MKNGKLMQMKQQKNLTVSNNLRFNKKQVNVIYIIILAILKTSLIKR